MSATAPALTTPAGEEYRGFSPSDLARMLAEGIVSPDEGCEVRGGSLFAQGDPYRFTVGQYERMEALGIVQVPMELLEGALVPRPPMNPPHATALQRLWKRLFAMTPAGWTVRVQMDVALPTSRPIPDTCVARGRDEDYETRHPGPNDLGLVVEVSDKTLAYDQGAKADLYAAAGIVCYWIVNLIDHQIEVLTGPSATGYTHREVFRPGQSVAYVLDGHALGTIPVEEMLPRPPAA